MSVLVFSFFVFIFLTPKSYAVPIAEAGNVYSVPIDVSTGQASFTLDGSRSIDNDINRSLVLYEWDLDGDEIFETSGQTVVWDYNFGTVPTTAVYFTVKLRITNDLGIATLDSAQIEAKTSPNAPYADPGGSYTIFQGEDLYLDGSASFDPDAGSPFFDNINYYSWDLDNDGIPDVESADSTYLLTSSELQTYGLTYPGIYQISLSATDKLGMENTQDTFLRILSQDPAPVPEPTTMLLLGTGLIGLLGARRKINK